MDAGDRNAWTGDHDVRPVSHLGRRQAEALAAHLTSHSALSTRHSALLYASPALRARQTLEPLAEATGLSIETLPAIAEKQPGEDRPAMVRRAWDAFQSIAREHPEATIATASHGDLIPALMDYLTAEHHTGGIPDITRRGPYYEIEITGADVTVTLNEGPPDFPLYPPPSVSEANVIPS
jgi:broad specificity phosphatase PhoE